MQKLLRFTNFKILEMMWDVFTFGLVQLKRHLREMSNNVQCPAISCWENAYCPSQHSSFVMLAFVLFAGMLLMGIKSSTPFMIQGKAKTPSAAYCEPVYKKAATFSLQNREKKLLSSMKRNRRSLCGRAKSSLQRYWVCAAQQKDQQWT